MAGQGGKMAYYENCSGNHHKFYRIELSSITMRGYRFYLVKTWRGRIGKKGSLILHGYATQEQAEAKMNKLHHIRVQHGYEHKKPKFHQLRFAI